MPNSRPLTPDDAPDDIQPPEVQKLAHIMDQAFQENSKSEQEEDESSEREESRVEEQVGIDGDEDTESEPVIEPPPGYTMSAIYPSQPCDRCVRLNRTCTGIAGSRCNTCKDAHSKCSNLGKPITKQSAYPEQNHEKADSDTTESFKAPRPKRKASLAAEKAVRHEEGEFVLDEDEGETVPDRTIKKRRTEKGAGGLRSQLLDETRAMGNTMRRLREAFNKEMTQMQRQLSDLNARIQKLDDG